ncbi:MAG TPA: transporter substrate-binding domain-containing protein [Spirochaetota bacterium]|nr:transporter substrate-binding domain-containing protein [Spirochaetota bacterium]
MKKLLIINFLLLSILTARSWKDIKRSDTLKVGIRIRKGVLNEDKKSGFHHDLIKEFAENHDLELELVIKKNIDEYFSGDIFNECDVIADNVTIRPEREKKMNFVKVLPIKQILVTLQGHERIKSLNQLTKETIIIYKGSSYYKNIKQKEKDVGETFSYYHSDSTDDQMKDLKNKKGTVTILDSNLAAIYIIDPEQILHAAVSSKEYIGWGTDKSNEDLQEELKKFIQTAKEGDTFSDTWDKYIEGIEFTDYLMIAGGS